MTSTSYNVGFGESKSSSRVLKPPGGGHTDIFGVRGDTEVQQTVKRKNYPPTTINSCFAQEEGPKPTNTDNKLRNEDIENGNQNGTKVDVVDENTEPAKDNEEKSQDVENKTNATPRRVRVPPGGFSSGLW